MYSQEAKQQSLTWLTLSSPVYSPFLFPQQQYRTAVFFETKYSEIVKG